MKNHARKSHTVRIPSPVLCSPLSAKDRSRTAAIWLARFKNDQSPDSRAYRWQHRKGTRGQSWRMICQKRDSLSQSQCADRSKYLSAGGSADNAPSWLAWSLGWALAFSISFLTTGWLLGISLIYNPGLRTQRHQMVLGSKFFILLIDSIN